MANTPNLDLENIVILDDAKKAYEQIVTEIIGKTNRNTAKLDTKSLLKADVTYVDTKVASVVNGSPKGTFATLALLQANATANTVEGKKYIYLVTADNNWYYWNGTAWTAGGIYLISKANQITLIDEGGYFDGANVELALQEVGQDIEVNKTDILTLNETVGSVAMTTVDQTLKGAINEVVSDINDLDTQQAQVLANTEAEKQQQLASNYQKRIEDYANIISMPNNASGGIDISLGGMSLKNELNYNRDTWAEWMIASYTKVINGSYLVVENNVSNLNMYLSASFKPTTKYGMLINVRTNTRTKAFQALVGGDVNYPFQTSGNINATAIGNFKFVDTTRASLVNNKYYGYLVADTGKIEFGDIRIFELPTGSQIETDFTNLTADQLAIKYPYIKGDSTKNVCGSGKMVFKGKNLFDKNKATRNKFVNLTTGIISNSSAGNGVSDYIKLKNNVNYKGNLAITSISYFDSNKNYISSITSTATLATFIQPTNASFVVLTILNVDFDNYKLEEGSTSTPYEPYVSNTTYVQAKENNLIVENRMLPNFIKDEFYYSKVMGKWKRKKNVKEYTLLASDIVALYTTPVNVDFVRTRTFVDAGFGLNVIDGKTFIEGKTHVLQIHRDDISQIGNYCTTSGPALDFIFTKGTTLEQARTALAGIKIRYQLATPIETDIDFIGEPKAYPSGSAEFEPCLWGYTSTASTIITDVRYPIKAITKVTKLDVVKGKLVETDVTADATISTDLLSLNIANIDVTKSYFYECEIDSQYSANAYKVLDVEVDNGIVAHDYLASVADWVLSTNEANATMLTCTNAGGSAKIIAPSTDGKMYVVNNTSGQNITVKTATSTGFVVKNKEKRILIYNGTDFILADNIQEQEDWITPTLLNGWTEVSGYPVRYMKDNMGFVHLKGQIASGTVPSTAFSLPIGYKPSAVLYLNVASALQSTIPRIYISDTAGSVAVDRAYTTYVCLDGISFKAEK